jgi:hypothetical protein
MGSQRERIVRDVWREAGRILFLSRQLSKDKPPGLGRARLKQLAEYAELVLSSAGQRDFRPPMFAGRVRQR